MLFDRDEDGVLSFQGKVSFNLPRQKSVLVQKGAGGLQSRLEMRSILLPVFGVQKSTGGNHRRSDLSLNDTFPKSSKL